MTQFQENARTDGLSPWSNKMILDQQQQHYFVLEFEEKICRLCL